MSNLEEIKKALEGVTVQEWTFDGPANSIIIWCGEDTRVCFMTSDGPAKEHAKFITACSPASISELLSTLESLLRDNEELRNGPPITGKWKDDERAKVWEYAFNKQHTRAEAAEAEVARLQAEIDRKSSMPGDHRYWEGRYRDEAAENDKLREILRPFTAEAENWHDSVPDDHRSLCTEPNSTTAHPGSEADFTVGDLRRARTALASTGGEHNAE